MLDMTGRKLVPWHSGWKTYAVCVVGLVMGVLQGLDKTGVVHVTIPSWANWCLAFLGMAAVRNAVAIRSQYITVVLCDLLQILRGQLTQPEPGLGAPQPSDDGLTGATVKTVAVEESVLRPAMSVGTGPQQGVRRL